MARRPIRLFHGTSLTNLKIIEREDRLRAHIGGHISLSSEVGPAIYFAWVAGNIDVHDRRGDGTMALLELDGKKLRKRGYPLTPFSDPFWGEGACNWEMEITCSRDIVGLHEFLTDVHIIGRYAFEAYTWRSGESGPR